jgi:dTDP-4-dehydrorhamnose reductase
MLGNAVFRVLSEHPRWVVNGTIRSAGSAALFPTQMAEGRLVKIDDIQNEDCLVRLFKGLQPSVAINCISLPRKAMKAGQPLEFIPVFGLLPHRLAAICNQTQTRLIHVSTDAVFSGAKGGYSESDPPDPKDLYGLSKFIGEPHDPNTFTIRTSMIGHELQNGDGLIEWFLAQEKQCRCFPRAVFSGLPTVTLAQIIRDIVIPRQDLSGIYHVAARPISKYDMLRLVAGAYGKTIELIRDESVVIDRSLNADRFRAATGYVPPEWPELIRMMRADWENWKRAS